MEKIEETLKKIESCSSLKLTTNGTKSKELREEIIRTKGTKTKEIVKLERVSDNYGFFNCNYIITLENTKTDIFEIKTNNMEVAFAFYSKLARGLTHNNSL